MKFDLFYPCLDVVETISHTTGVIINLGFFWILCIKNNLKEYTLWISRLKFKQFKSRQKINNQCFVATCTSALLSFAGFWPPPSQPVSFTSLSNSWGLEMETMLWLVTNVTINFIIRKFYRIISNTLVEVKLTKQDLMPKTMEPLISNWSKRRWTWKNEE